LNRDQVMTLETWLKIHTNVCNFVTASPKTILTLNFDQKDRSLWERDWKQKNLEAGL